MQTTVEIQDVEEMRQRVGIDDVELREQVRRLRVGDLVKLTFLAGAGKAETLCVRITSVRRGKFSGELVSGARTPQLSHLHGGSSVTFTRAHVHSVPRSPPPE